jgi:hypothetical protein
MKRIQNLIIFFLCLCVVGFFANFAQNDYGISIISISLIALGSILSVAAYRLIKHKKWQKIFFLINIILLFILIVPYEFDIHDTLFSAMLIYIMFIPTLIIPVITQIEERKLENKIPILSYYEYIFLAYLCIGYYMKISHLQGASIAFVAAFFIVIPYFTKIIKLIVIGIRDANIFDFSNAAFYLFIALIIDAAVFGRMHWKGAKYFAYISFVSYGLMVISLLIAKYKGKQFSTWWMSKSFINKTCLICFSITSIYWVLMRHDMAPMVYSNEMPKAYVQLLDNANIISKEGKEYQKRADLYEDHYLNPGPIQYFGPTANKISRTLALETQ